MLKVPPVYYTPVKIPRSSVSSTDDRKFRTKMAKRIVTVLGSTGKQGGSVVKACEGISKHLASSMSGQ